MNLLTYLLTYRAYESSAGLSLRRVRKPIFYSILFLLTYKIRIPCAADLGVTVPNPEVEADANDGVPGAVGMDGKGGMGDGSVFSLVFDAFSVEKGLTQN